MTKSQSDFSVLFRFFPLAEAFDHLAGQADEVRGLREGCTVKPFVNGEFLAVEGNGRIAVHIAVKSGEQRAAEGPRLTLIVSQILDL